MNKTAPTFVFNTGTPGDPFNIGARAAAIISM